jgi:hypothetical protein
MFDHSVQDGLLSLFVSMYLKIKYAELLFFFVILYGYDTRSLALWEENISRNPFSMPYIGFADV